MEPPAAEDGYERRYMRGDGTVLHREKQRAHWLMHLVLGGPLALLWVLTLTGAGSKPAPWWVAAMFTLILGFVWVTFQSLRIAVTGKAVHIQFGLFGPRIPVRGIERCEVTAYSVVKFGGWGIRRSVDGTWAYCMGGDEGRVVEIHWRDPVGRLRKVVVSSDDTERLAREINRARTLAAGVRVQADSDAEPSADDVLGAQSERGARREGG